MKKTLSLTLSKFSSAAQQSKQWFALEVRTLKTILLSKIDFVKLRQLSKNEAIRLCLAVTSLLLVSLLTTPFSEVQNKKSSLPAKEISAHQLLSNPNALARLSSSSEPTDLVFLSPLQKSEKSLKSKKALKTSKSTKELGRKLVANKRLVASDKKEDGKFKRAKKINKKS
jgi:hypothetical protein